MTKIWYHIWCEKCGRDDYIGVDESKESGHLATINTCRCGESSVFGGFHEEYLGEGHIIFLEVTK